MQPAFRLPRATVTLFSAVSPRTYKRESKQRNDAILSKLHADSFTMADPWVPANAVQEAQAILQNPAPDEAQALAAPAQAPAQQAQAPAQANEVSFEVCETLFSLSFATCLALVLELFVLFRFDASVLFCARPVFTFITFLVGFAGHASSNLFVFALPCC